MMELTPSVVRAPIGSSVSFTCKYHNHEQLEILVVENGQYMFRDSDIYMRCDDSAYKTWRVQVGVVPIRITCELRNKQGNTVGLLAAQVYPGLRSFPSPLCFALYSFQPSNGAGNVLSVDIYVIYCLLCVYQSITFR